MSGTVRFTVDDALRSIVEHAEAAPRCVLPYGDDDAPGPGLYIVRDYGVYLMSAGSPRQTRDDGETGAPVKYAEGLRDDDPDWYDRSGAICGYGDFAEFFPAAWARWAIDEGLGSFGIEFDGDRIRLVE